MARTPAMYYVYLLREGKQITPAAMALHLRVSGKTVTRWEHGERQPKALDLLRYAAFVQADMNDVAYLMTDPSATDHQAAERAEHRLAATPLPSPLTVLSREDSDLLALILAAIQHDQRRLHLWLGFGQGLIAEANDHISPQ